MGAMLPLYDYTTILRALRETREASIDAGLVVISAGFALDPAYQSEVRALADATDGAAMFRTDEEPGQAAAAMRASSVVIRGPRTESFGLTRAEAAMAGAPIVATPTGMRAHHDRLPPRRRRVVATRN